MFTSAAVTKKCMSWWEFSQKSNGLGILSCPGLCHHRSGTLSTLMVAPSTESTCVECSFKTHSGQTSVLQPSQSVQRPVAGPAAHAGCLQAAGCERPASR